jgi:hypothetical protein
LRRKALLFLALSCVAWLVAMSTLVGQSTLNLDKVPTGNVAAHLVGRLLKTNSEYEMFGYVSFAEGFPGSLFSGAPSEHTAKISFRSERFQLNALPNGAAFHLTRVAPADGSLTAVKLYYNAQPSRDFADPDTFSDGQQFAVLRGRGSQGILVPGFMFHVQGSLTVESVDDLVVGKQTIRLRHIVDGLNITFSGTPPSVTEFAASSLSVPLSASLVSAEGLSGPK